MKTFHGRIGHDGRVVIPASLRRQLGLGAGASVVMEADGDALRLRGLDRVVREVQEYFRQFVEPGRSVVDELIADRRAEAAREDAELAECRAGQGHTGGA